MVGVAVLLSGCATEGTRPAATSDARGAASPGDAELMGAPATRVLATLGEPELQRRESPAEIWQYRGARSGRECVLDVFLYSFGETQTAALGAAAVPVAMAGSAAGGPKQVVHMEARDSAAQATPVESCLDDLVSTRIAS
jgi:hypothetical protein